METLTTDQDEVMSQDKLGVDPVEGDAERITVTQEGLISNFEEITSIPNLRPRSHKPDAPRDSARREGIGLPDWTGSLTCI